MLPFEHLSSIVATSTVRVFALAPAEAPSRPERYAGPPLNRLEMRSVFYEKRAAARHGRSRRGTRVGALGAAGLLVLAGCSTGDAAAEEGGHLDVPEGDGFVEASVEVIEAYPHDSGSFTQGLELGEHPEHGTVLYESAGLYGESDVRITEPGTGEVLASQDLPAEEFAEGLTLTDDAIWQITWQEHVAYKRDPVTLDVVDTVEYEGEGWGICYDGARLVMSDGSSTLTFRDPVTFEETGTVEVTRLGEPVTSINELECVDGLVWANLWQTTEIVAVDPETGEVAVAVDDVELLTDEESEGADVLNGIAAAEEEGTFYLTGKHWPKLFLVRFV